MMKTAFQSVADHEMNRNKAMLPVYIVADDLTGACDTAGAFARHGMSSQVGLLEHNFAPLAQVTAVCTNTRDVDAQVMRARLDEAIADWGAEGIFFKKIDSVFRGNTFIEIAHIAHRIDVDAVLIAPAFPGLGRICREGILELRSEVESTQINLKQKLEDAGVPVQLLSTDLSQLPNHLSTEKRIYLADAETQEELNQLASHFLQMKARVCWIGSAGLAHAMASCMRTTLDEKNPQWKRGKIVFCIGSNHLMTCLQLEHLHNVYPQVDVLRISRDEGALQLIRQKMEAIPLEQIACVVMTGGDTALTVCRTLGVTSLEIVGEIAAGIPHGVIHGGTLDGIPIVLKSGGFGAPDLFIQLVELMEGRTSERA